MVNTYKYGQNLYDQNLYDQNLYDQNLYGQNLYGQNLYGQNLYITFIYHCAEAFVQTFHDFGRYLPFYSSIVRIKHTAAWPLSHSVIYV